MSLKPRAQSNKGLPGVCWERIFEFSHSSSLTSVYKAAYSKLDERVQAFLQTQWRSFPLGLSNTLTNVEGFCSEKRGLNSPKKKAHRYIILFKRLNEQLTENLAPLDRAVCNELRQRFSCSLSPLRFVLMHERISHLTCFKAIWPQIEQQTRYPVKISHPLDMEEVLSSKDQATRDALLKVFCLSVKGQGLSTVPQEIFHLSTMTHLNLSKNLLTDIPDQISNLQKLERLDLSDNCLDLQKYQEIVAKLLDLPELEKVIYHHDEFLELFSQGLKRRNALVTVALNLQNITPSFALLFEGGMRPQYSFLQRFFKNEATAGLCMDAVFSLQGCELRVLPEEMFYALRDVRELDLSDNPFSLLPEEIDLLKDLRELNLEHTAIPTADYEKVADRLAALPSLKVVKHHKTEFLEHFEAAKKKRKSGCLIS